MSCAVLFPGIFLRFSKLPAIYRLACCSQRLRRYSNHVSQSEHRKKMDDYFIDRRVQELLLRITNLDLEKIYRPVKEQLKTPLFRFMTDKQLAEAKQNAKIKAYSKIQMPPVMEIPEEINETLGYDPEVQGYEDSTVLFIDTTPNISERERIITARELDGTLRKATLDERFRMNQIFFPKEGRSLIVPDLFYSPHLDKLLDEGEYTFVLDKACIQFEPDDAEYHRVTKTAYEHINTNKQFDILRSTRHFGPMSFYFAWNNKIERLMIDMIEREKIDDAAYLLKLLCIMNPDLKVDTESEMDFTSVKKFIEQNSSQHKSDLELALQTYIEVQRHSKDIELEESRISS